MAVTQFTEIDGGASGGGVTANLTSDDTTEWLKLPGAKSLGCAVQAIGTFGGGTISVEVSNNKTDAHALLQVDGTAAPTLTSDGYIEVGTGALWLRVALTGGSGGDVDVWISGQS